MKEQEDDQEDDKNPHFHQSIKLTRNQAMHHQRLLQKLPLKHQGSNSTIFVYRSSQGQLYIFKAAQCDRADRIRALSNEFRFLQDIGQHSLANDNNNNANVGAPGQINPNNNTHVNPQNENQTENITMSNNQQGIQQQQQQHHQQQQIPQQQQQLGEVFILHHPHLVKTFGYRTNFSNENQLYHVMVLEFCQNGSMNNAMESMREIFNPFSCDQSYSTFLLSSSSAPKQVQKQDQSSLQSHATHQHQSPSPSNQGAYNGSANHVRVDRRGSNFTTLNLKIHIQVMRHLIRQLVSAISFIHSRGYYHGDIKLANILMDHEFNIKLTDFGSTSLNQSAPPLPEDSNQHKGFNARMNAHLWRVYKMTSPHLAPEANQENKNDFIRFDGQKADIFSLGIVLFCLMFNQFPFNATAAQCFIFTQSSIDHAWHSVQAKVNYLTHQHPSEDILNLIDLITQMLNPDPTMRPTIFEVEDSSWMNSTEVIEVPAAIKLIQLAQMQERQRVLAQVENQTKLKQGLNYTQPTKNYSTDNKIQSEDANEIEEEKLNTQGNSTTSSKKDPFLKESQHFRLQEAKERQEREILHTLPSLKLQDKESSLSLDENSSLQNSGEAVD